jgi:chromatin structure-remodeling complex subunit RSC4
MSELPAEFALPQYAPAPKIKLKPTIPASLSPSGSSQQLTVTPAQHLSLRVSGGQQSPDANAAIPPTLPAVYHPIVPSASSASSSALPVMPNRGANAAATNNQFSATAAGYPHYFPATSHQPASTVAGPASATPSAAASASPAVQPAMSDSSGPSSASSRRQLRSIWLTVQPNGRKLQLHQREGVTVWVLRLADGEKSIQIADISFFDPEAVGSDAGEVGPGAENGIEEEEEEEAESAHDKKGKGRGVGRPSKRKSETNGINLQKAIIKVVATNAIKVPVKESQISSPDEMHVRLNGIQLDAVGGRCCWQADISPGLSLLEVGEKGGDFWKVHLIA